MEPNENEVTENAVSTLDSKGRVRPDLMSDSDKLTEMLAIARATQDLVEKFFNDFASGKMGGMMGMMGKLMK